MASDDDLITVAKFASTPEAYIAQGVLDAENIRTTLINETVNDALWYIGSALGGVQLQVARRDEARARQVLENARAKTAESVHTPAKCPHCGAAVEPGFEVCWSCGEPVGDTGDNGAIHAEANRGSSASEASEPSPPEQDDADSTSDDIARRAWRAAIFGVMFPPFILYANYLVARLATRQLSPSATWQYYGTIVVVLAAVAFWCILYLKL